jgi:hypothetical protein
MSPVAGAKHMPNTPQTALFTPKRWNSRLFPINLLAEPG